MCQSSGSCQTDQDRQTQSSVEALCSAPSETRAQGPRPGMQATCGTFCEPGRWWAGPVKMAQNFPISKLPSFDSAFLWLLQNFAGIMTVDSYSFCFFFFFFLEMGRVWSCPLHSFNQVTSFAFTAAAKSLQWCPTLCDPIDGSPPGPAVPGILQARTLEWVAISFSNA